MGKQDRGFASMDREKQRAIASKGGKAAHAKGRAHEWTVSEAREAGRRGGLMSRGGRAAILGAQHDHAAGTVGESKAGDTPRDDREGDK